jgi:hypothetical protein
MNEEEEEAPLEDLRVYRNRLARERHATQSIVVTYEIRVFFEGAKKEVFSSIF